MKAWLPTLAETLDQNPVLAMSSLRRLARAAVFDRSGTLLAGALGSPALIAQAAEEARLLQPGECRLLPPPMGLMLECLSPDERTRRFWLGARDSQAGAWASWLLTMPRLGPEGLKLSRHILSAFGPWTTPRLPEAFQDQWSLLPLKAGLGRLFVLGDDALALEVALLGSRAGLTVTWLSAAAQEGPELEAAGQMGDFELETVAAWPDLEAGRLEALGFRAGVRLVVTTADHEAFLPALRAFKPAYLALAGEAENGPGPGPGLFSKPVTVTQKALGLVAEMLK